MHPAEAITKNSIAESLAVAVSNFFIAVILEADNGSF